MRSSRSSRRRKPDATRGFSLFELVAALGVTSLVMAATAQYFAQQAKTFAGQAYRLEAQQASRATLDTITRDLRLAGACLPQTGAFMALAGTDSGAGDTVTIRTGLVGTDGSCVWSSANAGLAQGATSVPLIAGGGTQFQAGQLLYLSHPNGSGEIKKIASKAGDILTLSGGLAQAYPAPPQNALVFGVDERVYWLDKSNAAAPLLVLQANWGVQQAFAVGVDDLQISYILDQNCPTCDVVDAQNIPDDATWRLVNEVIVQATVKTIGAARAEDQATFVAEARAKPRNLLP